MAGSRVRDCNNAAVDALKTDATLSSLLGGGKAYTHVPKGTDPPYVLVRGGDEVPWAVTMAMDSLISPEETDGGDNGARQVDIMVDCVSTGRGSAQVDSIADRVMEILTDQDSFFGLSGFQLSEFIRNSAQLPLDINNDGVIWYVRTVNVRVSLL